MDDDDEYLSDTSEISMTANFGDTARARQSGRRRNNRPASTRQCNSDHFTSDRYMRYYNGELPSSPAASSAALPPAGDDLPPPLEYQYDSDEDEDEAITEETANLTLRETGAVMPPLGEAPTSASQPPQPVIMQYASTRSSAPSASSPPVPAPAPESLMLQWLNSNRTTSAARPPARRTTDYLNDFSDDRSEWRLGPTNSNNAPPDAAAPLRDSVARGRGLSTAPPPPRSEGASQGGAPEQQRFGGGPSQFLPAAAPPVPPAEDEDRAKNYVTTVKERFLAHPEIYHDFLDMLKKFQSGQWELEVVLDVVSELFADHADLRLGFTYFLPDEVQSQAKAQLDIAVAAAEAEERDMLTAPPPDNLSDIPPTANNNNNPTPPTPGGGQSLCSRTSNLSLNTAIRPPDNVHGSVARGGGSFSENDSPSPISQQGERCGVFEDAPNTNTSFDGVMDMDVDSNDGGTPRSSDGGTPRKVLFKSGGDEGDVEEEQIAVAEEGGGSVVEEEVVVEDVLEGEEEEAFSEEMSDKSVEVAAKKDVICDVCADLLVMKARSKRSDMCCCEGCDVQTVVHLSPSQHLPSQSSASSVASSSQFSSCGRLITFKCLFADAYPFTTRIGDNHIYRSQKRINGALLYTSSCGSGQVARLELLCLLLARRSTINKGGTVTWSGVEEELLQPLKQFMRELQKDVALLKRMVDDQARKHLEKKDIAEGDNDVIATALRYVATQMENGVAAKKIKSFGLKRPVMKKIAEVLRSIAGNYDEDVEFPWLDGSVSYPFPKDWGKGSKKLNSKLENVEILEERVPDISAGLESVMAYFGCEPSTNGTRGQRAPPRFVTTANDPRRKMADFSLAALFEGLLCDPIFDDEDFCKFVSSEYDIDPTRLSKKERMEALLSFLQKIEAIPKWYVPSFLRVFDGDVNASADEVKRMKEEFKELIGNYENLKRLQDERQQEVDMEKNREALRKEHIHRCKVVGKPLLELICDKGRYFNYSKASISLAEFKDELTSKLGETDGLKHLSADDFPSLRTTNVSIWRNERDSDQRMCLLGKLLREVINALYPSSINGEVLRREPGDCTRAGCGRNFLSMDGSSFHGLHENATLKTLHPCQIALRGFEEYIEEMENAGIRPACALCHDGAEEHREFELDVSKRHLLSLPEHPIDRDDGRNLLQILRDNRVRRLQYILFFMDCHCRGMMKDKKTMAEFGDYNTLRVMFLAYFDTVADDVMKPSAKEWNVSLNTRHYIMNGLKHILQNDCGVCPGANKAGTQEAQKKPRGSWKDSDYACCEENLDFRKYTSVERQRIEGDHTMAQSTGEDAVGVADIQNFFELLDEICHAPFLCYFCHKRRTANQWQKNTWHLPVCDFTIG